MSTHPARSVARRRMKFDAASPSRIQTEFCLVMMRRSNRNARPVIVSPSPLPTSMKLRAGQVSGSKSALKYRRDGVVELPARNMRFLWTKAYFAVGGLPGDVAEYVVPSHLLMTLTPLVM